MSHPERPGLSAFDRAQGCPELDAEQAEQAEAAADADACAAEDAVTTERYRNCIRAAIYDVYDCHWYGAFPIAGLDRASALRLLEELLPPKATP